MKKEKISTKFISFIRNITWEKWIFSTLLVIVGILLISEGFQVYSLVCSRTGKASNTCEVSHFTLSGKSFKRFLLSQLKEARVEQSPPSRITVCSLVTEEGVLKFGSISSNYAQGKREMVSTINSFLQNPKQSNLLVIEPPDFSTISFGIFSNLMALVLFFCKAK
ncbi:MAG TPA: hypothetical protein V6D50_08485 [Chroococcales cyanobacterium]